MKYSLEPLDLIEKSPTISKQADEIINQIRETAFSLSDDDEVKLFIQNHQFALLEFKNQGVNYTISDNILHYLENSFLRFLDHSQKVSKFSRDKLYSDYHSELLMAINLISETLSPDFLPIAYPFLQIYGHSDRTIERFLFHKTVIPLFLRFLHKTKVTEGDICKF